MTAKQETGASLVLPAGYTFVRNHPRAKAHIVHIRNTAICGQVVHVARTVTGRPSSTAVCKRCVRAAQKKGLGVRYE